MVFVLVGAVYPPIGSALTKQEEVLALWTHLNAINDVSAQYGIKTTEATTQHKMPIDPIWRTVPNMATIV